MLAWSGIQQQPPALRGGKSVFFVVGVLLLRVRGGFFLLRVRGAFCFCCGCAPHFFGCACVWRGLLSAVFCCGHACGVFCLFMHAACFFLLIFAVGAGRVFFAAGAGRVFCCRCAFFLAAGARRAFLCAADTRRVFFYCGYAARFFCFGCAVPFSLYNAGAQRVFLLQASAGVRRGLFSSAGAAGGAVHGGWMHGEAGACVFSSGRGGQDEPGRRVYVFAAGARRVCLFFAAAAGGGAHSGRGCVLAFFPVGSRQGSGGGLAGANKDTVATGFRARNSDGGLSYTWSP